MPVELTMENIFERGTGTKFLLASTDAVLESLRHCWDPLIFLQPLTHRFWKMTLQILARYTKAGINNGPKEGVFRGGNSRSCD